MEYSAAGQVQNSAISQPRQAATPPPSPSDNLGAAIEGATRLHMKLDSLEARLFGSSPIGEPEKASVPEAMAWKASHLGNQIGIADARLGSILDRL